MSDRNTIVQEEPSEAVKSKFSSTTWATALFSDSTLHPFLNSSRLRKGNPRAETFTAETLATDDTIAAWQSFYKPSSSPDKFVEIISLLKVGSGINGHVDTCHGGFLSVVMDEIIGNAAEYERPRNKSTMTAYLKVDYKKPVKTPGVILCRSWLEKREGRKMWGRGTIEDGQGSIMTTGEALYLVVEPLQPVEKL